MTGWALMLNPHKDRAGEPGTRYTNADHITQGGIPRPILRSEYRYWPAWAMEWIDDGEAKRLGQDIVDLLGPENFSPIEWFHLLLIDVEDRGRRLVNVTPDGVPGPVGP